MVKGHNPSSDSSFRLSYFLLTFLGRMVVEHAAELSDSQSTYSFCYPYLAVYLPSPDFTLDINCLNPPFLFKVYVCIYIYMEVS